MTTPIPSGVSASAATRPTRRNNRTTKEPKDKPVKGRLSHDDWLASEMDGMIDNLCRKVYEHPLSVTYADTEQFCDEYADHVIDSGRVKEFKGRSRDLKVVLAQAESRGRVVIRKAHHGPRISIKLSEEEMEMQSKLAQERKAERDRKWAERRRGKEHWAVIV